MATIPKLDANILQEVCNVIGETEGGLSGTQLGKALNECSIADVDPVNTKRVRLFNALNERQEKDRCGNNVFAFVHHVMDPIRYTGRRPIFEARREALNMVLVFRGYEIGHDGKIKHTDRVTNLDEASAKANKMKFELEKRRVHAQVLRACLKTLS